MTFGHEWVLLFAWLPLLWAVYERQRTARRSAAILKALAFTAILLAFSEPRVSVSDTRTAVAVLVDTSASVTDADLARASRFAAAVQKHRGHNWTRVIPFARATRGLTRGEDAHGSPLRHTAGDAGRATDLEVGVRQAIASMPEGMVPRIVLVSDGRENMGSIARAAYQARKLRIPIDTVALDGRPEPALRLESVEAPPLMFTGERFPIDVVVDSPRPASAAIEIQADGKTIGDDPVQLDAGASHILLHASLTASGAIDIAVTVDAPGLGDARSDQAVTLRRPKVLYISQDPAGTEQNLIGVFEAAQFEVERSADPDANRLGDYQIVVLNNQNLESIGARRKAELERFVQQGGGLLLIGGEKNTYAAKPAEDALERSLPARIAPPRSPEGTTVVLIIDKSSSMEGPKIELARRAAIGVVQNLRPIDRVGVLIFDNSFQWAVPLRRAEDKSLIERLIAGIVPDGGTQIAPALTEAYQKVLAAPGTYKHIVLLTDGISEEGDSFDLARDALSKHVTISTVGLGQDVNRSYLEKVAALAGGQSYFLTEPKGLQQILLRDVMEHTGATAVEKLLQPSVAKEAEILEGVGMATAPTLKGYVRFIAKPTAETILTINRDPLLVRWQYGLGRAAVFTSDAKSRWAANWIGWKGYDRFWTNLARDLLPHSEPGEAKVDYDSATGYLVVDYRLSGQTGAGTNVPRIYAFGPDHFEREVPMTKLAEDAYEGRVPIGERQGLFRIRPVAESKSFPEVGYYRREEELTEFGSNEFLLRQVANFTGGRFNPEPAAVFDAGGRSIASTLRFWPGLLAIAIVLNLAELVMRKWRGIFKRGKS
jgi:Ca-activated chloride channel homolog